MSLQLQILLNVEPDSSGHSFHSFFLGREKYYSMAQAQRSLCTEFTLEELRTFMTDGFWDGTPFFIELNYDQLRNLFTNGLPRVAYPFKSSKLNDFEFFRNVVGPTFIHASVMLKLFTSMNRRLLFPKLLRDVTKAGELSMIPLENETRSACHKALILEQGALEKSICKYGGKPEDYPPIIKMQIQILYSKKEREKFNGIPESHLPRYWQSDDLLANFECLGNIINGYKISRPQNFTDILSSTIRYSQLTKDNLPDDQCLGKPLAEDIFEIQKLSESNKGLMDYF